MHGQSLYAPGFASTQSRASGLCSAVSLALLSRHFFLHSFSQTPGHTQNFYHSNPFYLPCSGNQQRYQQDLKPTASFGVAQPSMQPTDQMPNPGAENPLISQPQLGCSGRKDRIFLPLEDAVVTRRWADSQGGGHPDSHMLLHSVLVFANYVGEALSDKV